jgi:hypothetical protein
LADETGAVAPELKAMCECWTQMFPEEYKAARFEYDTELATAFETKHGKDKAGLLSYQIINGLEEAAEHKGDTEAAFKWRDFNIDAYISIEKGIIDNHASNFYSEFPFDTYLEAAKTIESDALVKYMKDAEVVAQLKQDPDKLGRAKCWGIRNQGMLKKGLSNVLHENKNTATRLWNELYDVSEQFRKGSYLLTPEDVRDDPSKDRFFGFRQRLKVKYDWLLGYLLKTNEQSIKELEDFDLIDPLNKISHNVRPSEAKKVYREKERNFLTEKNKAEHTLADTIEKLSLWNSYFGAKEDKIES